LNGFVVSAGGAQVACVAAALDFEGIETKAKQSIDLRSLAPIMRTSSGVCGSLNFL
jgi:hypothetical protein